MAVMVKHRGAPVACFAMSGSWWFNDSSFFGFRALFTDFKYELALFKYLKFVLITLIQSIQLNIIKFLVKDPCVQSEIELFDVIGDWVRVIQKCHCLDIGYESYQGKCAKQKSRNHYFLL